MEAFYFYRKLILCFLVHRTLKPKVLNKATFYKNISYVKLQSFESN